MSIRTNFSFNKDDFKKAFDDFLCAIEDYEKSNIVSIRYFN